MPNTMGSAHAGTFIVRSPLPVSVIIPTFNCGQFIAECLRSVVQQTWPDYEVIIVDDGSTDNTPEIAGPFLEDHRFKYIRTENRGCSAARNVGIRSSHGEIIAFLDADDLWRSDKLERQLPLFQAPQIGVVYSLSQPFGENWPEGNTHPACPSRGSILPALMSHNVVPLSSALILRTCIDKVGAFDERRTRAEDYDLWLRTAAAGFEFDYVPEPLVRYRMGHASLSSDQMQKFENIHAVLSNFFASHKHYGAAARLKATAWSGFFAKRAAWRYNKSDLGRAIGDAIHSLGYCAVNRAGWHILAKAILLQLGLISRKRTGNGELSRP